MSTDSPSEHLEFTGLVIWNPAAPFPSFLVEFRSPPHLKGQIHPLRDWFTLPPEVLNLRHHGQAVEGIATRVHVADALRPGWLVTHLEPLGSRDNPFPHPAPTRWQRFLNRLAA